MKLKALKKIYYAPMPVNDHTINHVYPKGALFSMEEKMAQSLVVIASAEELYKAGDVFETEEGYGEKLVELKAAAIVEPPAPPAPAPAPAP